MIFFFDEYPEEPRNPRKVVVVVVVAADDGAGISRKRGQLFYTGRSRYSNMNQLAANNMLVLRFVVWYYETRPTTIYTNQTVQLPGCQCSAGMRQTTGKGRLFGMQMGRSFFLTLTFVVYRRAYTIAIYGDCGLWWPSSFAHEPQFACYSTFLLLLRLPFLCVYTARRCVFFL